MSTEKKENIEIRLEQGETLKQKEKQKFISYLEEQEENKEREIVYITQTELKEFRKLIEDINTINPDSSTGVNHRKEAEQKLREFVIEQEKETITSSEILSGTSFSEALGGIEELNKISDVIEKASYEHFFGSKGILKSLNLSEDAKRNFAVGANFFMLDFLNKQIEKNGDNEDIQKSIEQIFGQESGSLVELFKGGKNISGILSGIKLVFESGSLKQIIGKVYKVEKEGILAKVLGEMNIEDSEKEAILMNPLKTKELLDLVYSGESEKNIKEYIEKNNKEENLKFKEEDKQKLQEVGNKLTQNLGEKSLGTIGQFTKVFENIENIKDDIKESVLNNKDLLGLLSFGLQIPVIKEFIQMFLDFLGIKDIDKLASKKNFEASKKAISENIVKKGSIFESKKIPEDFMKNSSGGDDSLFLRDISFLIGDKEGKDFEKGVSELFKKDGEFNNFIEDKSVNIIFEGENINYKNLKGAISLFRKYKTENKDGKLSVEDFMAKKKKQKTKNENFNTEAIRNQQTLNDAKEAKIELDKLQAETAKDAKATTDTGTTTDAGKREKRIKKLQAKLKAAEALKEQLTIKGPEKFEIGEGKIEGVFKVGKNFYQLTMTEGKLTVIGNSEQKIYDCGQEIIDVLLKFGSILDNEATASNFGKNIGFLNPKLGLTVKEILLNGYKKSPGLKQNFSKNFFTNGKLKTGSVNIDFNGTIYNFDQYTSESNG